MTGLLELINRPLTEKGLKIEKAPAAVIDATIIQTVGGKQRQAVETLPSKDKDARCVKKDGKFTLGYKQHTRTDWEGYIEKLHITPANIHECNHFEPLLADIAPKTTVYAERDMTVKPTVNTCKANGYPTALCVRYTGANL
ncbi:insertion element IS1106 transposase [Neisseria dentiae]|nr:transposase [Neisseria dentiae]STZ51221.1 insertion element IS1106 transposase [Neisseria dentiae]